jgi:hypothetical protein
MLPKSTQSKTLNVLICLTSAWGCWLRSKSLNTVNATTEWSSNLQGLSIVPVTVYRTYPSHPSNDDGKFGGKTNEKGNECCPGGKMCSSAPPRPSNEMTKITNSIQSHNSYRKNKSETGRTRTSEYIRGGIRCHGGVSIPCRSITPALSLFSRLSKLYWP